MRQSHRVSGRLAVVCMAKPFETPSAYPETMRRSVNKLLFRRPVVIASVKTTF